MLSSDSEDEDTYKYTPLESSDEVFRLIRLFKGSQSDPIQCEIFEALIAADGGFPYEALSYTWGSDWKSHSVIINGRILLVTANLHSALLHLRHKDMDRIIWADGLCIDQQNLQERGHQVRHMKDIYTNAEQVMIWLGLATPETDAFMDSLLELKHRIPKIDGHLKNSPQYWNFLGEWIKHESFGSEDSIPRTGLKYLLRMPWFERVWVLQEAAMARKATIYSGHKSIPGWIFALAPSIFQETPDAQCQAVLDIMPGLSRRNSWWNEKRDLLTLMRKFKGSMASEPRDRVFALLGISADTANEHISADYGKTETELVQDIASFLLSDSMEDTSSVQWTMSINSLFALLDRFDNDFVDAMLILGNLPSKSPPNPSLNLNSPNNSRGMRPLIEAVFAGDKGFISMLIKCSQININARDRLGKTALSLAASFLEIELLELLLSHPSVDINAPDWDGRAPIMLAAQASIGNGPRNAKPGLTWSERQDEYFERKTKILNLFLNRPDIDLTCVRRWFARKPEETEKLDGFVQTILQEHMQDQED